MKSVTRRKVIATGTTALAGLAAASVTVLKGQGHAAAQERNYAPKERANLEAMKSYFDGLKAKDVSRVRFSPNVTFTTAIIPSPAKGEAAVRKLTAGFASRLLNVRVDRYTIDGDFGCARFEIDWPENVVAHSIDYFQFSNGKILSIEVYWDPREYLALQRRTSGSAPLSSLRPHHVALSVPNFEETVRWYQEKLGFRVILRREFPQISTRAANLELNGFQIEIFTRDKSVRPKPPAIIIPDDLLVQGYKHIALLVDDLDATVAELGRRGVEVLDEPTRVDTLGLRLCFIKDNNGNLIELGQELDQNRKSKA